MLHNVHLQGKQICCVNPYVILLIFLPSFPSSYPLSLSLPFPSFVPKPDSDKYVYLFSPCVEQKCELTDTSGVVSAGGVSNSVCKTWQLQYCTCMWGCLHLNPLTPLPRLPLPGLPVYQTTDTVSQSGKNSRNQHMVHWWDVCQWVPIHYQLQEWGSYPYYEVECWVSHLCACILKHWLHTSLHAVKEGSGLCQSLHLTFDHT